MALDQWKRAGAHRQRSKRVADKSPTLPGPFSWTLPARCTRSLPAIEPPPDSMEILNRLNRLNPSPLRMSRPWFHSILFPAGSQDSLAVPRLSRAGRAVKNRPRSGCVHPFDHSIRSEVKLISVRLSCSPGWRSGGRVTTKYDGAGWAVSGHRYRWVGLARPLTHSKPLKPLKPPLESEGCTDLHIIASLQVCKTTDA